MALVLSQILNQDSAIKTLVRAIDVDKVHHAYLFNGPGGVGKKLAAVAMAMALNCKVSSKGCGECSDCRRIASANHPDVRILSPADGKRNILIEAIRDAELWIGQRPYEGRSRVLIITPADAMNSAAANALLKTLEEPRRGNHLILVTSAISSLLPTVRSRCQIVRFRALETKTVASLLQKEGMNKEQAELLASMSDGSMEKAVQYSGDEIKVRLEYVVSLFKSIYSVTPHLALETAVLLKDRIEAVATLELFLVIMNHILYARAALDAGHDIFSSYALFEGLGIPVKKLTDLVQIRDTSYHMTAINRAIISIKRNNMNSQMAVEGAIMSMRKHEKDGLWNRIGK